MWRVLAACAVLLVGCQAGPVGSTATYSPKNVVTSAPSTTPAIVPIPTPSAHPYAGSVAGFGDSIMLGGAPCLEPLGYTINAVQGRSFGDGWAAMQSAGDLPKRVVIGLGTNGAFTEDEFDAVMAYLGRRQVYWINIHLPDEERYAWANAMNGVLDRRVAAYDNAHLINWDILADQHPEWLYDDNTHLRPKTCAVYARVIDAAVRAPR